MIETPSRTFYRIVRGNPPTKDDFLPYAAMGGPPPADPQVRRLWKGVSVYDTIDRARNLARKRPTLGTYVAMVDVPWSQAIQAERTGHRRGHHTLWGDPAALLACVVRIVPV